VSSVQPPVARVAFLSLHTSPLDLPGTGDSGGMNVFVRVVAERLADRGVAVDVFTRCAGRRVPEVEHLTPITRVVQVNAGPCAPVPKETLADLVPRFSRNLTGRDAAYDLVHSHYWLSGVAGLELASRLRVPHAATFHTLARVKNLTAGDGEAPEPAERAEGEELVARGASRVVVLTTTERTHLGRLYGIPASRIRVVPPGVDGARFRPLPKAPARAALGLAGARVVLFAGRLRPHKGPEVAVAVLRELVMRRGAGADDVVLAIVGGPSTEASRLEAVAHRLGLGDRVHFLAPRPHERMPEVYAAADVVVVPSRSESFGMVALEAQACGIPVVASAVGGLRRVVSEGETGYLVSPGDAASLAERVAAILGDSLLAARLARGAVRGAGAFSWDAAVERLLGVYRELRPEAFGAPSEDEPAVASG
jgi:D-inositol-3-phosphate glycosyltransferase